MSADLREFYQSLLFVLRGWVVVIIFEKLVSNIGCFHRTVQQGALLRWWIQLRSRHSNRERPDEADISGGGSNIGREISGGDLPG